MTWKELVSWTLDSIDALQTGLPNEIYLCEFVFKKDKTIWFYNNNQSHNISIKIMSEVEPVNMKRFIEIRIPELTDKGRLK